MAGRKQPVSIQAVACFCRISSIMHQYDLIVVGGGIMGTFTAYHALRMGKKVLLLEKDNFPVGATVRNFGQIVPSGMAGKWFDYGAASLSIYKDIQSEYDLSVRENGSVYIASDPDEQTLIHELHAHYQTLGYPSSLLTAAQTLARYPALQPGYVKEALLFPQEISVEPEQMIYRLHAFMKHKFGAFTLLYDQAVIDCQPCAQGAMVRTGGGDDYIGAKAVVCSGYESKLLFPGLFKQSGIVISKLQMLRSAPMPEVALEGNILTGLSIRRYESFEQYCPSFAHIGVPAHYQELKKWGIHILFKKAVDGSIIIGDSHEYAAIDHFDDLRFTLNQHVNELMMEEARRIVRFDVRNIASAWAGFYPQHNERQIFEADPDANIAIRTGIGGKGMTASAGYTRQFVDALFN